MRELLLVRYGEIFLKGQNRPVFMRALVKRVKRAVQDLGATVYLNDSRIFVTDYSDQDEAIRKVTKVFGVHSVCPAIEMPKEDFDAVAVLFLQVHKQFGIVCCVYDERNIFSRIVRVMMFGKANCFQTECDRSTDHIFHGGLSVTG